MPAGAPAEATQIPVQHTVKPIEIEGQQISWVAKSLLNWWTSRHSGVQYSSKRTEVRRKGGSVLTGFDCIPDVDLQALYSKLHTKEYNWRGSQKNKGFMIRRTTYKQVPSASLYMTHYTYNHPSNTDLSIQPTSCVRRSESTNQDPPPAAWLPPAALRLTVVFFKSGRTRTVSPWLR